MSDDSQSFGTRPSLLERMRDWGQQTAWRQFHRDYTPLIRNFARKAGLNHEEANDVAQETMIAVAKKIGEFEHAGRRGSFRSWLYQQARWRIADQFRLRGRLKTAENDGEKRTKGDVVESQATEIGVTDAAFEKLWDDEWEHYLTEAALTRVKEKVSGPQFQLFDLHVLQGLSPAATAKAAGTSIAAVYMAKSRIGRALKREVNRLKLNASGGK